MQNKKIKSIACLLIALGVIAGAFGAHGLKDIITAERLEVFKTAVFYQITMSIVLLYFAEEVLLPNYIKNILFFGILIFSGTLYLLVLLNLPILGAITPIGGVLIISSLLVSAWKLR